MNIHVLTYNILIEDDLYIKPSDDRFRWHRRKEYVLAPLRVLAVLNDPIVIFLQEVSSYQIQDIVDIFPEEEYVISCHESACYDCIMHNVTIASRTLFPSDPQISSVVHRAEHRASVLKCDRFAIINTHFPTYREDRMYWTHLLSDYIVKQLSGYSIILGGDFNAYGDDIEDGPRLMQSLGRSCSLLNVTRDHANVSLLRDEDGLLLSNTFWAHPGQSHHGIIGSYNLDHILYSQDLAMVGTAHVVRSHLATVDGVDYDPSDHFPVFCTLEFVNGF